MEQAIRNVSKENDGLREVIEHHEKEDADLAEDLEQRLPLMRSALLEQQRSMREAVRTMAEVVRQRNNNNNNGGVEVEEDYGTPRGGSSIEMGDGEDRTW